MNAKQLQQRQREVQTREQQIVKGFEEPIASARQKTADALVGHTLAADNDFVVECVQQMQLVLLAWN